MPSPSTASTPRATVLVQLDGDGTIYWDGVAFRLLCDAIPELDYFPTIDYDEMDRRFVERQNQAKSRGEAYDGVTICNEVIVEAVKDGELPGLNREVLRAIGARMKLFPGVEDFIKEIHQRVYDISHGEIAVEVDINSCGLEDVLKGSALGRLQDEGYITNISGQTFSEKPVFFGVGPNAYARLVINAVQHTYTPLHKAENLRLRMERDDIAPYAVIYGADGLTDEPAMRVNSTGLNVLVVDPKNLDKVLAWTDYTKRLEGLAMGPFSSVWTDGHGGHSDASRLVIGQAMRAAQELAKHIKTGVAPVAGDSQISYATEQVNAIQRILDKTPENASLGGDGRARSRTVADPRTSLRVVEKNTQRLGHEPLLDNKVFERLITHGLNCGAKIAVDVMTSRSLFQGVGDATRLGVVMKSEASDADLAAIAMTISTVTGERVTRAQMPEPGDVPRVFKTTDGPRIVLRRLPDTTADQTITAALAGIKNGTHAAFQFVNRRIPCLAPEWQLRIATGQDVSSTIQRFAPRGPVSVAMN